MDSHLCEWKFKTPIPEDGVIVGCAQNQEWILPWWYMNYSQFNQYPITFIDFGNMSPAAKAWCQERGQLISLNIPTHEFVLGKSEIDPEFIPIWDDLVADLNIWEARLEFFKKPFACSSSPYQRTVWIDLDCQVFKSIQPIFDACENSLGIAVAVEPSMIREDHIQRGLLLPNEIEYNSGVIPFKHGTSTIIDWAEYCLKEARYLRGDQEALSRMLYERGDRLPPLPPIYNWRAHLLVDNENDMNSIVILHFLGSLKNIIQLQIDEFKERGINLSI